MLASIFSVTLALGAIPLAPLGEEEFGNKPVRNNKEWAPGVRELVNDRNRVYRRWVNGNEDFYFRGKLADINEALALFGKVDAPTRQLIVLPKPGRTKSFKNKKVDFDWRVNAPSGIYRFMMKREKAPAASCAARMFLHLDAPIYLPAEIRIPHNVEIVRPQALLRDLIRESERSERRPQWMATHELGKLAYLEPAAKRLIAMLDDESANVRLGAARALAAAGGYAQPALAKLEELAAKVPAGEKNPLRDCVGKVRAAGRVDAKQRTRLRQSLRFVNKLRNVAKRRPK